MDDYYYNMVVRAPLKSLAVKVEFFESEDKP